VNKKIVGLITTIAIISIIIGSTAVTAKEEGMPLWERVFSVFITNTDPIPVSVEGTVELEDNEVVVTDYTGGAVPITGTVELADGTSVSIDSLTDVTIKMGTKYQVVFDSVSLPGNTNTARIYHDVDGYKTIHIWCLYGTTGVPPLVDVDFSYPGIGSLLQVYTFSTTEFGTYDVIAPEISFQIINPSATEVSAPVTVIFYAQAW